MTKIKSDDPQLLDFIMSNEKTLDYFYLDSKGHPTIGCGHLIFRHDWPSSRQDKALLSFILMCKHKKYTFSHDGKEVAFMVGTNPASPDYWKDGPIAKEVYRLMDDGEATTDKYVASETKKIAALQKFGQTHKLTTQQSAELKKEQNHVQYPYAHFTARYWGKQKQLTFTHASSSKQLLGDDIVSLIEKPLKNGEAAKWPVEYQNKSLQILIYDVIFNQGIGVDTKKAHSGWLGSSAWKEFRKLVDGQQWEAAEAIVRRHPADIDLNRRLKRVDLLKKAVSEIEQDQQSVTPRQRRVSPVTA